MELRRRGGAPGRRIGLVWGLVVASAVAAGFLVDLAALWISAVTGLGSMVIGGATLWLQARGARPTRPVGSSAGRSLAAPVLRAPRVLRGRDSMIRELRTVLRAPRGRLVVLTGLGGAGKSAIALDLSTRTGRRRDTWWISARTTENLVKGLVSLAEELGGTPEDVAGIRAGSGRAADRLYELLGQARAGWLLVLDDTDDVGLLGALDGTGWVRPDTRGTILVTSRIHDRQIWGPDADLREVRSLAVADGADVLLDLLGGGDREGARQLAQRLGGLPLALHLAGTILSSHFSLWGSFSDYQRELDRIGAGRALATEYGIGGRPNPRFVVTLTWELSLDALAEAGIGQARPLLRLLSCFAPGQLIPVRLIDHDAAGVLLGVPEANRRRVIGTGLGGLIQLSLVAEEQLLIGGEPVRAVRLHPLVAETNRDHLGQVTASPAGAPFRQTAVELVATALEPTRTDDSAGWAYSQLLVPHVQELISVAAGQLDEEYLMRLVGATASLVSILSWQGAEWVGEQLAERALRLDGVGRVDHPAVLGLRAELAWAVGRNGRWADARRRLADVVKTWTPLADPDSLTLLDARHKLAWAAGRCGDWKAAHAELTEVWRRRRRLLTDDHPDTLHTRCCLAWATWRIGSVDEAERMYQAVIAARSRVLGDDHVETLDARHSLAEGYVLAGRYGAAEELLRSLLRQRERRLGPGHPETLEIRPRYWLARALRGQGRHREADRLLADLHADQSVALGTGHPATVATLARLRDRQDASLPFDA